MRADRIRVFQTLPQACGYWRGRTAQNIVLDPASPELPAIYPAALARGYRRAGGHVYRPACPRCHACVPCRIPVARFKPDRAQRRCLARNADLTLIDAEPGFTAERYALYSRYQHSRHPGGGMDDGSIADFSQFLTANWGMTRFLELRAGDRLLAVAATDVVADALSAVYTWYDPDLPARGLGTRAILWQIDYAAARGLDHVYLGFWIEDHPKMDYKRRFRPLELFGANGWRALDV